jgi:hypothetical protein
MHRRFVSFRNGWLTGYPLLLSLWMFLSKPSGARVVLEGIHWPMTKPLILILPPTDSATANTTTTTSNSVIIKNLSKTEEDEEEFIRMELQFQGAGVRSVTIFGWDIKVYVAGMYTAAAAADADTLFLFQYEDHTHVQDLVRVPMQLDFTFLRSVNAHKVKEAWKYQWEQSVDHREYDEYRDHRDSFLSWFGPIVVGGTESVQLLPDGRTIVIDTTKGVIACHDFQKSFLSMWFGKNAVAPDLKDGLLGNIAHRRQLHSIGPKNYSTQEEGVFVEL